MILGIDPGVAITGFSVIQADTDPILIDCGVIRTEADIHLPARLAVISRELGTILDEHNIKHASVESIIFNNNQKTGIQVAHARGVILNELEKRGIKIFEYSPPQVKKAITGSGSAGKSDIQEMVRRLLNMKEIIRPDDAADAVALAICHSHSIEARHV